MLPENLKKLIVGEKEKSEETKYVVVVVVVVAVVDVVVDDINFCKEIHLPTYFRIVKEKMG